MNKTTIIAIISFFVVGFLLGSQLHGCKGGNGGLELARTDTLIHFLPRHDTIWQSIELTHNIPYTIWGHDTIIATSSKSQAMSGPCDSILASRRYVFISDTAVYADSIHQANEFKAIITDTLTNNRIIGRNIRWADIAPIEVRDITKTMTKKSALIKVYAGAETYGGKAGGKINIDLAPAASVVFADRYMLDIGYYIFNQQVTAGLKIKLSKH
jgi:hypothetical protein